MKNKILFLSLIMLIMFILIISASKINIYDDMNDSSINWSLWDNFTYYSGEQHLSISESGGQIIVVSGDEVYNPGINLAEIFTTSFPSYESVYNISTKVNLWIESEEGGPLTVNSSFFVYGTLIKKVEKTGVVSAGIISDLSVYYIVRNLSAGENIFDVYDDGVFLKQITASNNVIKYSSFSQDNGGDYSRSITSIDYLYWIDLFNVELNSPENNSISNTSEISFNCSTQSQNNLKNISLYTNSTGTWNINETIDLTSLNITNYTAIFNKTFYQENFIKWDCEACDNESCVFADSNYTFEIDASSPNINLTYPTGTFNFGKLGQTLNINWSVYDKNIDSCWYNYNNTNTSVNCLDNYTTFNITEQKNLTFYANDTVGNLGSNTTFWDYKILEINQTYNNETLEGSLEDFNAVIKLGEGKSIISATLFYNGETKIGTSNLVGDYTIIEASDLQIPIIDTDTNFSFYWNIILSDSTIINLTSQNQSVLNLNISNCSVFTNIIFNFTSLDEETQELLSNTTQEIALNIYSIDREIEVLNFSGEFSSNPNEICLSKNLTGDIEYSIDILIRYGAIGYENEYYNIVNYILDNDSGVENILLYDLNSDDSTDFQLTFTGIDFLPIENALIFVNRKYISEDNFKTVELPKTDSNGQTILHLVRNEIIYDIIVMKDGKIIGTFRNLIAFCDDFTIGECKITLNALSEDSIIFNYDSGVGILYESPPIYNDTTNIISFSFSSTDGTSKIVSMDVERSDVFGNTSICTSTLVSSSGTLFCNIGNITDSTLTTTISVDLETWLSSTVIIDDSAYGSIGYVFFFFLSLILILIFGESKNGVMISMLFSYVTAISLGWFVGGIIGIGSSGVWILVITIIGIWQINRRGSN